MEKKGGREIRFIWNGKTRWCQLSFEYFTVFLYSHSFYVRTWKWNASASHDLVLSPSSYSFDYTTPKTSLFHSLVRPIRPSIVCTEDTIIWNVSRIGKFGWPRKTINDLSQLDFTSSNGCVGLSALQTSHHPPLPSGSFNDHSAPLPTPHTPVNPFRH